MNNETVVQKAESGIDESEAPYTEVDDQEFTDLIETAFAKIEEADFYKGKTIEELAEFEETPYGLNP